MLVGSRIKISILLNDLLQSMDRGDSLKVDAHTHSVYTNSFRLDTRSL